MLRAEAWSLPARLVAAALGGALLSSAYPPLSWSWMAPIALVPVVLALRGARGRHGALVGLTAGLPFFGILLYWISYFGYLAWTLLVLLQAGFWAIFGLLAARVSTPDATLFGRALPSARVRTLTLWPLLWGGAELARARWPFGGFSWGALGYSQATVTPVAHIARIGGSLVVGIVLVLIALLVVEALVGPTRRRVAILAAIALAVVPVFIPLGLAGASAGTLDIAAIQGNAPRDRFTSLGRRGRVGPEDFVVRDNHVEATRSLVGDPPDLIVWPENSLDRDPRLNPDLFEPVVDVVRAVGAPLIAGAILDQGDGFTNSNILVTSQGEIADRYDKMHLVPFGEYVPWDWARSVVPALNVELPVDGIPGEEAHVFDVAGARVGTVICFESIYADPARDLSASGAQVLVVTTNNASFGTSPAARQHLAMSRFRAIENGRALVHAAISGMSAIVMPDGSILRRGELFTRAVLRAEVPLATGTTLSTRFGRWIEGAVALVCALAILAAIALRRRPA